MNFEEFRSKKVIVNKDDEKSEVVKLKLQLTNVFEICLSQDISYQHKFAYM